MTKVQAHVHVRNQIEAVIKAAEPTAYTDIIVNRVYVELTPAIIKILDYMKTTVINKGSCR